MAVDLDRARDEAEVQRLREKIARVWLRYRLPLSDITRATYRVLEVWHAHGLAAASVDERSDVMFWRAVLTELRRIAEGAGRPITAAECARWFGPAARRREERP